MHTRMNTHYGNVAGTIVCRLSVINDTFVLSVVRTYSQINGLVEHAVRTVLWFVNAC